MLPRKRKSELGQGGENVEKKVSLQKHSADILKRCRNSAQTSVKRDLTLNTGQGSLVTVETSVCDENGSNLIRHFQINLLSHCIFCLRRTTQNEDLEPSSSSPSMVQEHFKSTQVSKDEENVPGGHMSDFPSSSPQSLSTFNSIWTYVRGNKKTQQLNEDPLHLLEESKTIQTDEKGHTTFLDLPNICPFCDKKVEAVHQLFLKLRAQLNTIRKIMDESKYGGKYSWRAKIFEKVLTTSNFVERDVIAATMNVLGELGPSNTININEPQYDGPHDKSTLNSTLSTNLEATGESFSSHLQNFASTEAETKEAFVLPSPASSPHLITPETIDRGSQFGALSSYVEVPSVDSAGGSQNFIDEDDEWNDSDPDYIKSEVDDDDDFSESEEEESSETEIDEECKQPRMKPSNNSTKRLMIPTDQEKVSAAPTTPKVTRRQQLEQSGALLVQVDSQTRVEQFICKTNECGKTYNTYSSFCDHHRVHHTGKTTACKRGAGPHQCETCGKRYARKRVLLHHIQKVHVENVVQGPPITCDLCHKTVKRKDIHAHVRDHVGDQYLLPCPNSTCGQAFALSSSLCKHLNRGGGCRECIPNAKDFLDQLKSTTEKCDVCGQAGMNRRSLRGHLERVHEKPTKNFSCPMDGCGRQFTVKQSVAIHIYQHAVRQSFEEQPCDLCSVQVKVEQMENHLKETHGVGAEAVIKCKFCPFLFSAREHLVDHLFEHNKDSTVLSCDICGINFPPGFGRHAQLREHYMNVHNVGQKFSCELCDTVCSARYILTRHMATEHRLGKNCKKIRIIRKKKQERQRHKCDICQAVYSLASDLQEHKIKLHNGDPFSCTMCTQTFLTRKLHSQHEREHAGMPAKPEFKCDVEGCGKIYPSNAKLKLHVSAHKGEKLHVCEICGKAYGHPSGLKSHMNSYHLGLRSYTCPLCDDAFTNGSTLKKHILIHSKERPFVCHICSQPFRQKEVLRRHVEAHQRKGADFKPNGPMKQIRKRVEKKK